jgi:hypothetical protein
MKEIPLTQGFVALVDDGDYEELNRWKWHASKTSDIFYAIRKARVDGNRQNISMHRQILNFPSGMEVDHIDGNGTNNRRANLRICTHAENTHNQKLNRVNTSGFKGVSYHNVTKRWRAYLKFNRKYIWLGSYDSPHDAAVVYDINARVFFGEYARLNFPERR